MPPRKRKNDDGEQSALVIKRQKKGPSPQTSTLESYRSVFGYNWLLADLLELVLPLKYPSLHRTNPFLAAETVGVLLYGPSGTGKSLIARALAGEYGFPLVELKIADLVCGNEEEKAIDGKFDEVDSLDFSILLLDQMEDLLLLKEEIRWRVVRKISQRLEASAKAKKRYLVIGTTNQPDCLPPELSHRFNRRIAVQLPGMDARQEILRRTCEKIKAADWLFEVIAARTQGFTGAELVSLVHRATFAATKLRVGTSYVVEVELEHFEAALKDFEPEAVRSAPVSGFFDRPLDDAISVGGETWSQAEKICRNIRPLLPILKDRNKLQAVDTPLVLPSYLLHGPTMCGKTTLVQTVAQEAKLDLLTIDGSKLRQLPLYDRPAALKKAFDLARNWSPCVLFLDNYDLFHSTSPQIGAQLLDEIKTIRGDPGVFLFAAHRSLKKDLGPAAHLVYFSNKIHCCIEHTQPDVWDVIEYLSYDFPFEESVDFSDLAGLAYGLTNGDLAEIPRRALCIAMEEKRIKENIREWSINDLNGIKITMDHFRDAVQEIRHEDSRRITVVHETDSEIDNDLSSIDDFVEE